MTIVFVNNFQHSLRHMRKGCSFIPRIGEEIMDDEFQLNIYREDIDESPLWEVARIIYAYSEEGEVIINVYLNNVE